MKVRVAIVEQDTNYLNRLVASFNTKYADKLEIYSFSNIELARETISKTKIDVILISYNVSFDYKQLPEKSIFAYLVDASGVDFYNESPAICKFQKTEQIYKQILSLYSEKAEAITMVKGDGDCKTLCFTSPAGGVGTTTMAAACAEHMATLGKKVLYLNLESFGVADNCFSGEGQFGLSDVVYAIKSKKNNLALKLESCVRQDNKTGVFFYSKSNNALDLLELEDDETKLLIQTIQSGGEYDYLILDLDFYPKKSFLQLLSMTQQIVFVCDNSDNGIAKTNRAVQALEIKEESEDVSILSRAALIYNKFARENNQMVEKPSISVLGYCNKFRGNSKQIIEAIAKDEMFNKLI